MVPGVDGTKGMSVQKAPKKCQKNVQKVSKKHPKSVQKCPKSTQKAHKKCPKDTQKVSKTQAKLSGMVGLGWRLSLMILEAFSNLLDLIQSSKPRRASAIPPSVQIQNHSCFGLEAAGKEFLRFSRWFFLMLLWLCLPGISKWWLYKATATSWNKTRKNHDSKSHLTLELLPWSTWSISCRAGEVLEGNSSDFSMKSFISSALWKCFLQ